MEIKLLSDQLNSALEHVTSSQGVGTLPDELIPEPAFELIQKLEVLGNSSQYAFQEITDTKSKKERTIVRILKSSNPRFSVKTLLQDDNLDLNGIHQAGSGVTFIGFRNPEKFERKEAEVWQIKVCHCEEPKILTKCHCGEPKRRTECNQNLLRDSCSCGTFEVTDFKYKERFGSSLSFCFSGSTSLATFENFHTDSSFSDESSTQEPDAPCIRNNWHNNWVFFEERR
eukprot:GHVP01012795.1.p1 GENE.GHVP01012795.1~~GHVP01012795.1.p1  ORF type:complete len:238 (+),score=26.88 GHVP01012795.1:33-716(+)